jgi:predicted transcriptional regulator
MATETAERGRAKEVEALKAEGLSMGAIGKRLGISKASVSRILSGTERGAGREA